jgi:hypothetical protein
MNIAAIAAIVKRHGTRLPGGDWELLAPEADIRSIPQGSTVREYVDPIRRGVALRLSLQPLVIDITPTAMDGGGDPTAGPVPPQGMPLPELRPKTA